MSPSAQRRSVIEELNLAMLFLDAGAVVIQPDDGSGSQLRRISAAIETEHAAPAAAALLCRVLHNTLVSTVRITRDGQSVRLECRYPARSGDWTLELTTRKPDCRKIEGDTSADLSPPEMDNVGEWI